MRVCANSQDARASLKDRLSEMLVAIDSAPVTRQQKMRLYKLGICSRLSWPLLVEEFPTTWLDRELQPLATRYLKRRTQPSFSCLRRGVVLGSPHLLACIRSSCPSGWCSSSSPMTQVSATMQLYTCSWKRRERD